MRTGQPLWLLLVLLVWKTRECDAVTLQLCELGGEDHVTIEQDMTTREFRLLTNSTNGEINGSATIHNSNNTTTNGSRRLTASQSVVYATMDAISIPRGLHQVNHNHSDSTGSVRYFSARRCECADRLEYDREYYCKSSVSHCAVPSIWSTSRRTPVCLDDDPRRDAIRYIFLFVLALYLMILSCLLCTENGRGIFHGIITLCCYRPWNTRLVRQIQQHDQRRTNRLLRSYWRRRRLLLERQYREMINNRNDQTSNNNNNNNDAAAQDNNNNNVALEPEEIEERPKPTHLALRTRIYHRGDYYPSKGVESVEKKRGQDDFVVDDDEEEHACTICFGPLVEGDRVGALDCGHVFHVECLKTWLSRRNACPLCATAAAEERFDPESCIPATTDSSDDSSNDNAVRG